MCVKDICTTFFSYARVLEDKTIFGVLELHLVAIHGLLFWMGGEKEVISQFPTAWKLSSDLAGQLCFPFRVTRYDCSKLAKNIIAVNRLLVAFLLLAPLVYAAVKICIKTYLYSRYPRLYLVTIPWHILVSGSSQVTSKLVEVSPVILTFLGGPPGFSPSVTN